MRDKNETKRKGEINRGCKKEKEGERERRKGERMRKR